MRGEDPLDRQEGGTQSRVTCGIHAEGDTEVSVRVGRDAKVGQKFCLGKTDIFISAWRVNSPNHIMT